MFFIEAPAKRDNDNADAFEVTVPTSRAQEYRIGERIAIIEAGMAAITLGTVKGCKVSDTPSEYPDELRGVEDGYAYVEGKYGDRVSVELEGHDGTHDILPHFVMAVSTTY